MHNVLGQNVWIFSLYIHCLQKESASFGLRVLIILVTEYQDILGSKNHRRNIDKFPKFSYISKCFDTSKSNIDGTYQKHLLPPNP